MADNPNDKTPEAIQKHKPQQNFDMKGPGGSAIRQQEAEKTLARDRERFDNSDRASKYAKMEKEKIADKEHVREGTKGRLTPEMEKATKKEREV